MAFVIDGEIRYCHELKDDGLRRRYFVWFEFQFNMIAFKSRIAALIALVVAVQAQNPVNLTTVTSSS